MLNAFDVAKYFLELAKKEGVNLDPMKLLKLVYIAHGYFLGLRDMPLISNEVQAWKYGPVIPELYHVTKRFGSGAVDIDTIDLYTETKELDEATKKFLGIIWNGYKEASGLQLSTKTHEEGTPWFKTFERYVPCKVIPNELIGAYYRERLNSGKEG